MEPRTPPEPSGNGAHLPESSAHDAHDEAVAPPTYTCPHCGEAFALAAGLADRIAECPACQTQFFIPTGEGDWNDADEEEKHKDPAPEFNELRIRQIKKERRGLIRTRSYAVVAVVAVAIIAGQLIWLTIKHVWLWHLGWGPKPIGFLFGAIACGFALPMLLRRLKEINQELASTAIPEPQTPPDLSTLSSGEEFRQRYERNLEQLQNRGGATTDDESSGDSSATRDTKPE